MKIAVIGAMDEEVELLKSKIDDRIDEEIGGAFFHRGHIDQQEIVLVKSGIGKVNAAISTAILIHQFQPDVVINTGAAGGFNPELEVGDVVISNEVRYNDVDATVFGYEYGQVPQMPARYVADESLIQIAKEAVKEEGLSVFEGLILSGDSFMNNEEKIKFLKSSFQDPQCAEMEAGAIAQVCYRFDIPFVVIRSLSDIAGKDARESYDQFLEKAAVHSANVVLKMIHSLKTSKDRNV
ncbi:5'-methylthioadenosine/S-adenosylhomocysteine nucleosidase [Aliibacillus thermotolerans]|uniref:5'-methylthioadenosine/S-adenosylhomocysteine nucleosidase n=1 Tax=Aliibacillus thermotolerans TaxID=1834418 RepID=A0ABW0UBT3_9BACI|nr:5'-methylthioadenosine/S-adenosylhomocysteine nucleosidase [Aliibacillus thermotolerans]MDA3130789.1 5'-methylthioadenosine/S-adenosylhomocysteine nucleosidase [Aliibacillus thermotolerans]